MRVLAGIIRAVAYRGTVLEGDESAMKALGARDVLMYVKSENVIRMVLPPDAQDEALRRLRANGYDTYFAGSSVYGARGGFGSGSGYFGNKAIRAKELPEPEEDAIRRVWATVRAKGLTLHLVDVGVESALRRVIEEHLHHLRNFPVLVRPDGRRLEGAQSFSEENLAEFLSG